MWTAALGVAVFLQAGATRADEAASAVHVECPSDAAGGDCNADETVVPTLPTLPTLPETPPAAAAAAAVAAVPPAPSAFATVSFRNDVGKSLRLVEAHFTMDGEKLPVVLTSAEPGKSYVLASAVKPGPHVVTARLTYRGDRTVFSYMKGYKLNVRSDQVLSAPADRTVSFTVVGSENKGMTVPIERRVVVKVENGTSRK